MRAVRFALCLASIGAVALTATGLGASEPAAVVVTVGSSGPRRVQISEGLTAPCDSGQNRMLFEGRLAAGETFRGNVGGDCICIRNTFGAFRDVDRTVSGFACRPRVCRGRICRPAADPTIRVSLP